MATKPKDSPAPGKEKKSPSALNSLTNNTRKLTKSSSTTTSDKTTSSSTSTTKQIPNYLRPTLSASRHENSLRSTSAGSKKHGSEDPAASHKPTLNRRRSFDKPPSAARLHKSLVSPPLRSLSFAAPKSSNAPKPGIERSNSKTLRAGKPQPQPLYAKSGKKSCPTSGSVKKDQSSGGVSEASAGAPKSQDMTQTLNLEADLEAIESLSHHEVEEVGKIESEEVDKVVLPDPKDEEIEHVDDHHDAAVEAEGNSGEEEKVKPSEDSTVNAEELKENVDDKNVESGNTLTHEEKSADIDHNEGEENPKSLDESSETQPEGGLASEETKVEVKEDKETESTEENAGVESKNVEDKALDEKVGEEEEEVNGGIEDAKPTEAAETAEAAEAAEATEKLRQVSGGSQGGKKDSAPAYNDVIEETASKLLEKRKNKVKALVGAFETVIDYESGSK